MDLCLEQNVRKYIPSLLFWAALHWLAGSFPVHLYEWFVECEHPVSLDLSYGMYPPLFKRTIREQVSDLTNVLDNVVFVLVDNLPAFQQSRSSQKIGKFSHLHWIKLSVAKNCQIWSFLLWISLQYPNAKSSKTIFLPKQNWDCECFIFVNIGHIFSLRLRILRLSVHRSFLHSHSLSLYTCIETTMWKMKYEIRVNSDNATITICLDRITLLFSLCSMFSGINDLS